MFIVFDDDRPSDSRFVERVWRAHSTRAGTFLSVASSHWELVITRLRGEITAVTLRGPETRATDVHCPADGEWFAIRFAAGTFMPQLPVAQLMDGNDVVLPLISGRSFMLNNAAWEFPSFDNAEAFVARLAKAGLIARDPAVAAALQGETRALSKRSAQRHFVKATGMTYNAMRQIERARHATALLKQGVSIVDTMHEAGFFDQAHLTRSLRHLIGLTPAKIARDERQLSFLYKKEAARQL
jgi:AraC-like DNA-binding protein